MKHLFSLVALVGLTSGLSAQVGNGIVDIGEQGLVVGFDFWNNETYPGFIALADLSDYYAGPLAGMYSDVNNDLANAGNEANYTPRGYYYFDGSRGSSDWNETDSTVAGGIGGFDLVNEGGVSANRAILTPERTSIGTSSISGRNFEGFNNVITGTAAQYSAISLNPTLDAVYSTFAANTIGFEDLTFSLAGRGNGTLAAYYSIDGGATKIQVGSTVSLTSTFEAFSFDFSAIAQVEQKNEALFILGITGDGQQLIDNVQIIGIGAAAIPEPSTYAAIFGGLVLLGALVRRRARQA